MTADTKNVHCAICALDKYAGFSHSVTEIIEVVENGDKVVYKNTIQALKGAPKGECLKIALTSGQHPDDKIVEVERSLLTIGQLRTQETRPRLRDRTTLKSTFDPDYILNA